MAAPQPGQITLASMRVAARQHANQSIKGAAPVAFTDPYANSFITTPELNQYINASYAELYELMVKAFESYWFTQTYSFTTAGTEMYPLPLDMFHLISCAWVPTPGNTQRVVLQPFNVQERGAFGYSGIPISGQSIELLYVPLPLVIADTGTITLYRVGVGDSITINGTTFTGVASAPGTLQFVIGSTDTDTATNLAAVINGSLLAYQPGETLRAQSSGAVVTIVLYQPAVITWSTVAANPSNPPTMALFPNQITGPLGATVSWSNTMTSYAHWSEYVIVDAAIKMMVKKSFDPSALMAQKAALLHRIEGSVVQRDAGSPKQVTDMVGSTGYWGAGGRGGPSGRGPTPWALGNFRYAVFGSNLWLRSGW